MRYLFLVCVVSALSFVACSGSNETERPNVIIILTDDQGWGDLSVHGNSNINTPNIDELSARGASLENFYVCAVCSPTRAELLTGRYNFRGGVYSTGGGGERLDMDETTIAELFQNAGYSTAAYGKWHNGMQYPYHPNGRGFEDYYGFCSGHWGNYHSPMLEHNGQIVKGNGFMMILRIMVWPLWRKTKTIPSSSTFPSTHPTHLSRHHRNFGIDTRISQLI